MESDGRRGSAVIQPFLAGKVPPTAFGRISQCQGPDRRTRVQVQDWKRTQQGAVAPNLAVANLRASAAQPVWSLLLPGLFSRQRNRDGSADGAIKWGTPLAANDPGRPVRDGNAGRGGRVSCLWEITGWLSWSVSAPSLVSSRAPRLWASSRPIG